MRIRTNVLLNDVHAFDDDMAVVNAGEDGALRALVTASNDDDFVALRIRCIASP